MSIRIVGKQNIIDNIVSSRNTWSSQKIKNTYYSKNEIDEQFSESTRVDTVQQIMLNLTWEQINQYKNKLGTETNELRNELRNEINELRNEIDEQFSESTRVATAQQIMLNLTWEQINQYKKEIRNEFRTKIDEQLSENTRIDTVQQIMLSLILDKIKGDYNGI